ncbi:MAG: fold metallo-hydrolase [Chitinophagaceae bacterium]|nr:fold metallo-hydrolase [Chitinophagaceae bacterium]
MKILKKILKWTGIVLAVLLVAGFALFFIYVRPVLKHMEQTHVIKYDKDLTIVEGGGGNSGILVSDSLVLVIDTKMGDAAEELSKMVHELAGNKPIVVVNTHYHSDHIKGNVFYKGQHIIGGGNYTKEEWIKEGGEETLPTQWVKDQLDIKMGDDTATIFNINRNAHTVSDVVVYLHKRKMLFTGDVILNQQAPALVSHAADPDGYLEDFNMLQKQFDIQQIVPGHGPIGGIEILNDFRQYFYDMETAANDDTKRGELVKKYDGWIQVPFLMSTGATISAIKKKGEAK